MSLPPVIIRGILLASIIFPAGTKDLRGQLLQTPEKRVNLLQSMKAVLATNDGEKPSFADLSSPFVYGELPDAETETAPAEEPATEPATPQQAVRLSDAEALRLVSRRFRPLGSLVLGSKGVLQMGSGRNLAEGESFQATVNGVTYRVFIHEVKGNGYILRLGNEFLKRDFLTTGVKRNAPGPEASPPQHGDPQPPQ